MAVWAPWARVLVCGDYLSPVEIPTLSATGSRDAYLATLERLRPLVAAGRVGGTRATAPPIEGARALAILDEDVRYLTDWELPLTPADCRAARGRRREPPAGRRSSLKPTSPRYAAAATSASMTIHDSASAWISK